MKPSIYMRLTVDSAVKHVVFLSVMISYMLFNVCYAQDSPNYMEMRRYIIDHLSDDEIRELHERAKEEFVLSREREQLAKNEYWRRQSEIRAKCEDIVFKERNPLECRPPGIMPAPDWHQYASERDAFERLLMGLCLYATTVEEAKKFGCLPQD